MFDNSIAIHNKSDRALFILLNKYIDKLPEDVDDINWFHKMFSECDVTGDRDIDDVIYNLISASNSFFKLFDDLNS